MTTSASTPATAPTAAPSFIHPLRRLYFIRFAFAAVWAGLVFATAADQGPLLTVLLIVYPLFDAGAILWQLRVAPDRRARLSEWAGVTVSVIVALALGITSTFSLSGALIVWGAWAIGSGIPQLITAIRNRRSGGQVAQMLSGGISVFAGAGFLIQGIGGAETITGVAGYATLGAIFFLVSAIRLSILIGRAKR